MGLELVIEDLLQYLADCWEDYHWPPGFCFCRFWYQTDDSIIDCRWVLAFKIVVLTMSMMMLVELLEEPEQEEFSLSNQLLGFGTSTGSGSCFKLFWIKF